MYLLLQPGQPLDDPAAAAERETLRPRSTNPHGACSPAMMAGAMGAAVLAIVASAFYVYVRGAASGADGEDPVAAEESPLDPSDIPVV